MENGSVPRLRSHQELVESFRESLEKIGFTPLSHNTRHASRLPDWRRALNAFHVLRAEAFGEWLASRNESWCSICNQAFESLPVANLAFLERKDKRLLVHCCSGCASVHTFTRRPRNGGDREHWRAWALRPNPGSKNEPGEEYEYARPSPCRANGERREPIGWAPLTLRLRARFIPRRITDALAREANLPLPNDVLFR